MFYLPKILSCYHTISAEEYKMALLLQTVLKNSRKFFLCFYYMIVTYSLHIYIFSNVYVFFLDMVTSLSFLVCYKLTIPCYIL